MKTLIKAVLILTLTGCASSHWSNFWPYTNINPRDNYKYFPNEYENSMTLLDTILKEEAKHYFKNQDSSIAIIEISENIGGSLIGFWKLSYDYPEEIPSSTMRFHDFRPPIIDKFATDGITDPEAIIRVIFSCYYKKLNNIPYSWNREINIIKSYWINPDKIYKLTSLSKEMRHREDSILNRFEFIKMELNDTIVCLLRRPPVLLSKTPNSYYLTGTVHEKRESSKTLTIKLTHIESDKSTTEFILDNQVLVVGDTLSDFAINWHRKKRKYFDYYHNEYYR